MCADIVELRKGDHTAERLQIERERLELEKEKTKERIREKLEASTKQRPCGKSLSTEERARRLREIFKWPPKGNEKNGHTPETLAE